MSDFLTRLNEKSISDYVREEELEQVFDVGQFEKVEVSRSFDPTGNKVGGSNIPVKIGATVEYKYSPFSGSPDRSQILKSFTLSIWVLL